MRLLAAIMTMALVALAGTSHAAVNESNYVGRMVSKAVTLPAGTKTAAINLQGYTLVGVQLGAFTGTALTFEASSAIDGTFVQVKASTSGTTLSYTVAQNTFVALDPKDFYALSFIKLVSGSSEGSDRTLILYLKGF